MRAIWSARQNCSHNVSQKVKRIRHLSEIFEQRLNLQGSAETCVWARFVLVAFPVEHARRF